MKPTNLSKSTLRKVDTGVYFHVYNRRVNGQAIFLSEDNYNFLLHKLEEYSLQLEIIVIAYCLMPTHYHFLIEAETRTQVSKFIQKLFNSYSQAFNKQQKRTGTLFESRAKFKLIDTDEYAMEVCSYIHQNPVKAGLTKKPEDWKYSNYNEWVKQNADLQDPFSIRFFDSPKEYEEYVKFNLAKGRN